MAVSTCPTEDIVTADPVVDVRKHTFKPLGDLEMAVGACFVETGTCVEVGRESVVFEEKIEYPGDLWMINAEHRFGSSVYW